jgi:hypothetical protein
MSQIKIIFLRFWTLKLCEKMIAQFVILFVSVFSCILLQTRSLFCAKQPKNNMSRFNRFEIDFTIHLKIRSEQPDGTYRYSTKTITSDYCYNLHDDLATAEVQGLDNQQTDDFMTGQGVNITNVQQKLLEFNNRYDMLLPVFTTDTPSMQQWERYVEFIFDARPYLIGQFTESTLRVPIESIDKVCPSPNFCGR